MLPLLALTYTAARLGFEAQNAAAFRLLRLAGGISKRAAEKSFPRPSCPPSMLLQNRCGSRRKASRREEIHKKSAAVRKRRKRG